MRFVAVPPMNFDYSDEQVLLKDQARKFLSERCTSARVRAVLDDASRHYDADLWKGVISAHLIGTQRCEKRAPLSRSARQLAATFGTLGQGGAIPSTTQGLDKLHSVHHAAAKNIYRSDFVGESCTLSGCYFEVAGDAALVARDGEFQIFLSCDDGSVLNLSFVLEDPQCGYVVLDLLEARQHSLAIIGDGLIVRGDGLV